MRFFRGDLSNQETNIYHRIGKRDAVVEVFMTIRVKGERVALREIALRLLSSEPENPHARWYLEKYRQRSKLNGQLV